LPSVRSHNHPLNLPPVWDIIIKLNEMFCAFDDIATDAEYLDAFSLFIRANVADELRNIFLEEDPSLSFALPVKSVFIHQTRKFSLFFFFFKFHD